MRSISGKMAASTPVSCIARTASGACGSERIVFSAGHRGRGSAKCARRRGDPRFDPLLGLEGEANAVARHEFEQAQRQFRLHVQALRGAEVDALPMHA